MVKYVVIEIIIIFILYGLGLDSEERGGIITGPLLVISGIVAWFFRECWMGTLFWYSIAACVMGIIVFIGTFFPNIREMLQSIIFGGIIAFFSYKYLPKHRVICTIGFILAASSALGGIAQAVENIRDGINPDDEAREKRKKREDMKRTVKITMKLVKFYRKRH